MYTAHKMSALNNNNTTNTTNDNNNITTNAAQQGSFVSYNWLSVSQHQPTTQAVTQPSSFALVQPSASQQSLQFNPNQQQQQQVQNYQDYSQSLPLNSNLEPQLSILLQQQQVLSNHLQQQLVGSTLQQQFQQQQQQQSSQPLIAYNNYTTFCPLNNDTQASIDNKGQKDSINTTNNNNNNNNNNSASNNLSCDFLEPNPINIMGNANVTVSQQLQRSITNTDNGGIRNININNKIGAVNNRLNPVSRRRNLPRNLNEREHFLIFVKILFKLLQSTVSPDHCRRAKSIVNECTRRNRLGEADYTPLQQAVTNRLRHVVGDTMWQQTHVYLDKYCRQHGLKIAPPMSAIVTAVV